MRVTRRGFIGVASAGIVIPANSLEGNNLEVLGVPLQPGDIIDINRCDIPHSVCPRVIAGFVVSGNGNIIKWPVNDGRWKRMLIEQGYDV